MTGQKAEGLQIGQGMIQPRAIQRAVQQKPAVAQFQTLADRQHGVGIILLHREHLSTLRHIAQRIKIANDAIGRKPQLFQMGEPPICRQHIV